MHKSLALFLAICLSVFSQSALAENVSTVKITLDVRSSGTKIDPNIYGQFVEHLGRGVYEGIWVGENSPIPNVRGIRSDVVAALRKIQVPLIRWPGGCFAEFYHWRDGVGSKRPMGVNTAWGDERETNAFGTHEFMDFANQVGAKPFLAVNLATGSPREAQEWLQYLTGPTTSGPGAERAADGHPDPYAVPFIGVGNENWGCGGNMTADYYSDIYRQYYSVLKSYGTIVAADANSDDYSWTETLLKKALYRHANPTPLAYINRSPQISMLSVHYYTLAGNDWGNKGPATGFSEAQWASSMLRAYKMDEILQGHIAIMDRYDPERKIGLAVDEWGTWWNAEKDRPSNLYQVTTLRDAVIAGLTLNIFQNRAERVHMANIAQLSNVLQAMVLTRGEKMIVTPTYHVFDLYKVHQGAELVRTAISTHTYRSENIEVPSVSVSASRDAHNRLNISLVNLDPNASATLEIDTGNFKVRRAEGNVLTAQSMDAHPDFDTPDMLLPKSLKDIKISGGTVRLTLAAKSVSLVTLEGR